MGFHQSMFFWVEVKEKELRLLELRPSGSRFELAHPRRAGTIPAVREFMHCDSSRRNCKLELGPKLLSLMSLSSGERVIGRGVIVVPRSRHHRRIAAISKHKRECCHGGKRHYLPQWMILKSSARLGECPNRHIT